MINRNLAIRRMILNIFYLFLLCMLIVSCSTKKEPSRQAENKVAETRKKQSYKQTEHKETDTQHHPSTNKLYKTKTGKIISVMEEYPRGKSLCNIILKTYDFEHNLSETIIDCDPLSDTFIADVNSDGFSEIYLVTTSAGSGSYGNIIGFSSNKGKNMTMIHIPKPTAKGVSKDDAFFGYRGHDSFSLQKGKITRTFPVYLQEDTNSSPKGGKRKLIYTLYPGEASWQMKIEEIINYPHESR